MSREKGCALFLLFALTLAVTSDAWAQRRRKSKPSGGVGTPAGETSAKPRSASEGSSEGEGGSASGGFPALERAEKFYLRGDYYMASI